MPSAKVGLPGQYVTIVNGVPHAQSAAVKTVDAGGNVTPVLTGSTGAYPSVPFVDVGGTTTATSYFQAIDCVN